MRKLPSITQQIREAGYEIKTECYNDEIGPFHKVTIKKDGKQTMRRARKYKDALALCAEARNI